MSRPIAVIGISRRSGTNFLWRLLRMHPECATPAVVLEDHLASRVDLLDRYVEATAGYWDPQWGALDEPTSELRAALGGGLERFLAGLAPDGRPLVKTPDATHLARAARYLEGSEIVVLVRDGRSVAESYVRAFDVGYEEAFRRWRSGARGVIEYLRVDPARRERVVRYEDLVTDTESTLRRVLDVVGLAPEPFDWASALGLPVYGSSFARGGTDELHWEPVERPASFDPTRRHGAWSTRLRERFAWVAGEEMRALGYELDESAGGVLRNRALDAAVAGRDAVRGRLRRRGRSRG